MEMSHSFLARKAFLIRQLQSHFDDLHCAWDQDQPAQCWSPHQHLCKHFFSVGSNRIDAEIDTGWASARLASALLKAFLLHGLQSNCVWDWVERALATARASLLRHILSHSCWVDLSQRLTLCAPFALNVLDKKVKPVCVCVCQGGLSVVVMPDASTYVPTGYNNVYEEIMHLEVE